MNVMCPHITHVITFFAQWERWTALSESVLSYNQAKSSQGPKDYSSVLKHFASCHV